MQQVAKDLINGDQVSFQDFQEVKRKSLDYFRVTKMDGFNTSDLGGRKVTKKLTMRLIFLKKR